MLKRIATSAALLLAAVSNPSIAGGHHDRGGHHDGTVPVAENKLWHAECSVCHTAYPPGLLPERSWRVIMGGLNHHFGENASLDPADQKSITDFLAANAADRVDTRRGRKIAAATPRDLTPLRITEYAWFERKHGKLAAEIWKRKEVGSPANCGACHAGAEEGRFKEHEVTVPGLAWRRS